MNASDVWNCEAANKTAVRLRQVRADFLPCAILELSSLRKRGRRGKRGERFLRGHF